MIFIHLPSFDGSNFVDPPQKSFKRKNLVGKFFHVFFELVGYAFIAFACSPIIIPIIQLVLWMNKH